MLITRPGAPADRAFVVSTMLKSLRSGCHLYRQIDRDAFNSNYGRIIDKLLNEATLNVVCLEEDHDVIIGYAITRGIVLDYVYVKKLWRRQGVANSLCEDVLCCTHLTSVVQSIVKKRDIKFNPFV